MAEPFDPAWTPEIGAAAAESRMAGESSSSTRDWFTNRRLNYWPNSAVKGSNQRIVPTLSDLMQKVTPADDSWWSGFRDTLFDAGGSAVQIIRELNELTAEGSAELQNSFSQGHTFSQILGGELEQLVKGTEQHGRNIRAAARGLSNEEAAAKKQADEEARAEARKGSSSQRNQSKGNNQSGGRAGVLKKRNKRKLSGQ